MAFTIEFEELHTYPRVTWQDGIFVGTRKLSCAWDERDTFINEIDTWPNNEWPYDDGPSDALANRVAIEPFGRQTNEAGSLASYEKAHLTVQYTNAVRALNGGATLLSEWTEFYTETRELDEGLFRWDSNTGAYLRDGEAPHYALHGLIYVARFHRVSPPLPGWVMGRIGSCNSNVVVSLLLGLAFAAETMLYQPPKVRTTVSLGRLPTCEVTASYRCHPVGWNTFLREESGLWEPLYVAGGARYKPYTPMVYS